MVAGIRTQNLGTGSVACGGQRSDRGIPQIRCHVRPAQIKNLAAFSDGLQNLALINTTYEPFEPFFSPLFEFLSGNSDRAQMEEKLGVFLGSEKICGRTDDDKTLLLAAPLFDAA